MPLSSNSMAGTKYKVKNKIDRLPDNYHVYL
jgi:hypothetical protein